MPTPAGPDAPGDCWASADDGAGDPNGAFGDLAAGPPAALGARRLPPPDGPPRQATPAANPADAATAIMTIAHERLPMVVLIRELERVTDPDVAGCHGKTS
jgi:hypothetical protein